MDASCCSIYVGLPRTKVIENKLSIIPDKLWIYFQRRIVSNSCDVNGVSIVPSDRGDKIWMKVIFCEPSGVEHVLSKSQHKLALDGWEDIPLEVRADLPSDIEAKVIAKVSQDTANEDVRGGGDKDIGSLQQHPGASRDAQDQMNKQHQGSPAHNRRRKGKRRGKKNDSESTEEKQSPAGRRGHSEVPSEAPTKHQERMQEKESQDKKEEEGEEEDQFVEVRDFNQSSIDMLRMYFETPTRSGGGAIKTWTQPEKEVIRMTFVNPSVTSKVIERKHKYDGAKLIVQLKKPRPVKKRCLFLSGIPDGCNSEHMTLLIENRSGMEPEQFKIRYGDMPGTALCTFTKEIQDIEKVIADISSEPLSGAHLTAKKVKEPDCILVDGLSRETSLKIIQYYFGNEKESGGTGVRDVQQGPTDTQAIVYFEDWKAVGDVLSKRSPHKIGDTELLVEEYHECLGRLSPVDVPTPHVPKPVIVQVQEPIMEFIFGEGQHTKTKLIQKLRDAKAILKWPDGDDKTSARLEPLLEDRQGQSSWLQWSETASRVVTDFLNRCKSSRIAVPPPFWKDVINSIDQLSTKSFSIQPDASTHVVTLTGEQQDVDKGCNDINRIIEKSRAKAEYEAQHKEEGITLTEEKSQFFIMCGIKDNIEKDFPNLKITVISLQDKIKLIFEGSREIVQEAELSMRRQMDSLERVELKTGRNKVRFVQNVTDKIHEILRSQSIRAACNGSDDGKIVISGASKKDTVQAKAYIDQEIREVDIAIKDKAAMDVLQSPNGQRLLEEINRQKSVMVAISNCGGNIVEVAGFKDNLGATKQKVMDFLKDNVIVRKTVPANKNKVYLITKFHGQDLVNLEKQNARNHVKIQQLRNGGNKGFVIQGNEEGSEAARQAIASLIDRIKGQQYPVSKTGMAQLLREQKGRRFLESLESDHECVIRENVQEDSDGEAEFEESTALRPVVPAKVLCRIALPNGFTLKVCRGDLTRQKVDCIVNAANTKLNHDTGLAAAIVEAGGKVIQDECEQIMKTKGRRLFMGEAVHTTNGKLPCKTVIHVAGPKWPHRKGTTSKSADDEPTSEERLLCGSIINCLKLANKLNLQSIAIPAISTGVYGFPVDLAAKQILNAVAEFCQNTPDPTLTEIHFINNDQPTSDVFRTAVMDRFSQFHVEKDGTDVDKLPGGESWDPPIFDFVPQTAHASARAPAPAPAQAPAPRITSFGQTILTTMEGINITLKKGSITSETVDVIVNTAGTDMNLSEGAVSKAILQAAGQALQLECSTVTSTRGKIPAGEYIETGPAALTCKKVYHCVCESYNSPARAEQFLKELVLILMEHAEQDGMLSIAIPALGTGNLNYPADFTARVMYESVLEFSSQHPNGVLKDVRFVVYEKDVSTVQCFESEIQRLMTPATSNGATGFIPSGHEKKLIKTVPLSGPRGTSDGSPVVGGVPQPVSSSALAPRFTSPGQNILTTMEGINITLKKGSITDETVDVIVNTAGSDMNLSGGAVSKAILQAAGQRLQLACNNVTSSRGNIQPGEFIETGPANLTCKTIYHCVCEKYSPARAEKFLKELVLSLMEQAEQDGMVSIAIPALGTGILDYPADVTARVMYESVLEFSSRHPNGVLKDVRFVVYEKDTKTAQCFESEIQRVLTPATPNGATGFIPSGHGKKIKQTGLSAGPRGASGGSPLAPAPAPVTVPGITSSGKNILTTIEGINITLKKGSITHETVDVIVNTAGTDMNLSEGAVSKALLRAAGKALQLECSTVTSTRGKIPAGEFIQTGPAALTCKKIYHCVCEKYSPATAEKFLKKLVLSLMEHAEQDGMVSIAIPALGTGILDYPADVTARVMYESVLEFSSQHHNGVLKDVHFVVYDKDVKTIKCFESQIQTLTSATPGGTAGFTPVDHGKKLKQAGSSQASPDRQTYSAIQSDDTGMLQTKIGSLCLQVEQGDLVKETTDAIVLNCDQGLDVKDPKKQIYCTAGGPRYQCTSTYKVVTPRTAEETKDIVLKTLQQAEDHTYKSVALPALGAGNAGQSVADCARAMLKAVGEFAVSKKPHHLRLIRLVISQPAMASGFQNALMKVVGTSFKEPKGMLSKGLVFMKSAWAFFRGTDTADTPTDDESFEETIILNIYAMDMSSIKKAAEKIDQFQNEEYTSEDLPDEDGMIDKMNDKHRAEVTAIEKKCKVKIQCSGNGDAKSVQVQGCTVNVKDACLKIHKLFSRMQKDVQQRESLSKEVQWKYSTPHGMIAYDPEVNFIIEEAFKNNLSSVSLELDGEDVIIYFQTMREESDSSILDVQRIDLKNAPSFEVPSNWIPMKDNHLKVAPLVAGTPEYTTVERKFQAAGGRHQIKEIHRIQNKGLMMQYQACKAAMVDRLGRADIEESLFHGTDEKTCDNINNFGFNRSFCGKNATYFGNGTYFAVEADYSAQQKYAQPDAHGLQYMYLAKVLVGDYTKGCQGMKTPPNKPNSNQQYDSAVNDENKPGIYVIFHDTKSYPEYLIKFQ